MDGVTTNLSFMAKEGIKEAKNILQHNRDICNAVDGDVSAEVIATDFEGMIQQGEEDVTTGSLSSIKGLLRHPLADSGLAQFLADYAKGN